MIDVFAALRAGLLEVVGLPPTEVAKFEVAVPRGDFMTLSVREDGGYEHILKINPAEFKRTRAEVADQIVTLQARKSRLVEAFNEELWRLNRDLADLKRHEESRKNV